MQIVLVLCKVLPESEGLDDKVSQVFGDLSLQPLFFYYLPDPLPCYEFDIRHAVTVAEYESDFCAGNAFFPHVNNDLFDRCHICH